MMTGKRLQDTIAKYSTKIVDGVRHPVEVTDGLRVLGTPIGSTEFCQNFIMEYLRKAKKDAASLLSSLFNADVFNSPIDQLPPCLSSLHTLT